MPVVSSLTAWGRSGDDGKGNKHLSHVYFVGIILNMCNSTEIEPVRVLRGLRERIYSQYEGFGSGIGVSVSGE